MAAREEERGNENGAAEQRSVTYCLIPAELASSLHELLLRHFRDDPAIEVIVESRSGERRDRADRRDGDSDASPEVERRRIRSETGRRITERRLGFESVAAPPLPRRARRYAERLTFIETREPSDVSAEDVDTARLVTRFQAGEAEVFTTLYTRYFDRVYGYLRLLLRDSHEAEDAAQHVFLKALAALPAYERRRQPFRAWLFVIVRNQAIQMLRKSQRVQPVEPAEIDRRRELDGAEEIEFDALDWIADRDLMLFVERLPLAQRQVLLLRYVLGLNTQEIATILERRPNEIAVLHYRAMEFLRKRLAALGRHSSRRGSAPMRRWPRPARILRRRRYALL